MKRMFARALVIIVASASVSWAGPLPTPPPPPAGDAAPDQGASDDKTGDIAAGLEGQSGAETDTPPVPFSDPTFGPRYTIERIVVRGNRKTEAALILGEIGLRAGDQVTASDSRVEAARIRLLALGFFLDARLGLGRGTGRGGAVLIVDVEERGTVILNAIYLGSSAATAFWGGLDVAENNLLGRGISLGTGFVASSRPRVAEADHDLGARIRALVPPLGGTGISIGGTGLLVSGSEFFRVTGGDADPDPDHFVALRTRRVGGVLGLGRALTQSTRFFLDFREEGISADLPTRRTRTAETGGMTTPLDFSTQPGFSLVGSITATIDYDTRSDPLVPRAGTHVALSAEGASDGLLSNYQFMKVVLQGSFYRPARRGHIVGLHLFGGALYGNAPLFDRFFIADMNLLLPPRALGMNFSTQPSRDLLGTSIAGHRYDNFAARAIVEYAVPLWRKRRFVYSGDAFVAVGGFIMGSSGHFRDPARSGFSSLPVDLTGDLGVRLDTTVGVFTLGFANALGRMPF